MSVQTLFVSTLARAVLFGALGGISSISFAQSPEAPAGYDDQTIESGKQDQHDSDRKEFDTIDLIKPDGLGPIYNAQACRECHQNPVSGAASQILELRAGFTGRHGEFL